jgi:hypothetical protein
MKTKEEFLTRGEGNFINCTDYDSALEAMQLYATQESAKAVAKRNNEIKDWMENNTSGWYSDLLQFLSTTSEPPKTEQ